MLMSAGNAKREQSYLCGLQRLTLSAITLAILTGFQPQVSFAQNDDSSKSSETSEPTKKSDLLELLKPLQQPGDQETEVLPSSKEKDPAESKQLEALSWFMTGRTLEHQNKFQEAYEAYAKSLEIDDSSPAVYRVIIPLAFRLEKTEEAVRYAQKAVELDPNNFELLSQLGIYALRKQDVAGSVQYFEKAVHSQNVDKKGGPYISIMSQLGQLYLTIGKTEEAARTFEKVFDAITNPEDYSIDYRTQQALETLHGTKAQTYERFAELFLNSDRLELAEEAFQYASKSASRNPEEFQYQIARILTKREQPKEALEKLQTYFDARLRTKGKGPYILLSEILSQLDQSDDLIPQLEALVEKDPANEPLQFFLADQYLKAEDFDKAEAIYEKLSGSKQQDEVLVGLLQIYRHQGNVDKTLETLTGAMLSGAKNDRLEAELDLISQNEDLAQGMIEAGLAVEDPEDKRSAFAQAYLLAKLAIQRDDTESVVTFYDRAMKWRPQRQIVIALYAELIDYLNNREEFEKLILVLEEAIDSPLLVQQRQAFQLQLVGAYTDVDQFEEALELIAEIQETTPEAIIWPYQEARIYMAWKKWEKAAELLTKVLTQAEKENNSELAQDARYQLSRCLTFAGMSVEALQLMDNAIGKDGTKLLWRFQKGWIHYYIHNWADSISAFQELLKVAEGRDPEENLVRQANFMLSAAYVANEQFDEGERILEAYYERNQDDVSVCNDLGYLYADRGKKLDQAEMMIQKAVDSEPDNHAYLDSMGWVLFQQGKYEKSLEYLQKAVEGSEEGDAVLWDHLGDCYHALDQKAEATKAWEKALRHEQEAEYPNASLIEKIKKKLNP